MNAGPHQLLLELRPDTPVVPAGAGPPLSPAGTPHDLRKSSVRGGMSVMAAQGAQFLLMLLYTAILARLLTPEDFGLVAMVAALLGFVTVFADLGLSQAAVQAEHVTHEQASNLFWLNLGVGTILTAITAVLSPLVGWFYGEPRLVGITIVAGLTFLALGGASQHRAMLQRRMAFSTLAVISVGATLCGVVAAIAAALAGAGYWALLALPLVEAFGTLVALWTWTNWRPKGFRRATSVRSMIRFGGYLSGFNILNYIARQADNVLIGSVWGAHQLGLYSRAYSLLLLPLSKVNIPVAAVALPMLGQLQHDPVRFRKAYLRMMELITSVTLPGIVFMTIMATEICLVMLGPQWTGAVTIFRLLGIASAVQAVTNPLGVLIMATGRTDRLLRFGLVNTPATLVAFAVGLPYGAVGVAASYSIYTCISCIAVLKYACATSPVSASAILGSIRRPLVVAGGVGVALGLFTAYRPDGGAFRLLVLATLLGLAVWLILNCTIFRTQNPLKLLREWR